MTAPIPTPGDVLEAIKLASIAMAEFSKAAQTPQGQAAIERALRNDAEFRAFMGRAGSWFGKLFRGDVFKGELN